MVRDIASAIDPIEFCFVFLQATLIQEQVIFRAAFPQGENMRMLTKQQVIFGLFRAGTISAFDFQGNGFPEEFFLVIPGLLVIDQPQILKVNFR